MKRITFWFLLFAISCENSTSRPRTLDKYEHARKDLVVDVLKWKNEILDIDSTLINGKINVLSSKTEIINHFGPPAKVIDLEPSLKLRFILGKKSNNAETPYKLEYENISFYGLGDRVILESLNFSSNLYLENNGFVLSNKLYSKYLCDKYPESCKLVISGGNLWSGHIELRVSNTSVYEDLRWFLVFSNENLVKIELYQFFL